MFTNLRDFIGYLENSRQLEVVRGADWDLEIGALTEQLVHHRGTPVVLFDEIKGYPKGRRILVNALNTAPQIAAVLNFPEPEKLTDKKQLISAWRKHYQSKKTIPPVKVSRGPVLENVERGDAVDLLRFPAPRWHKHDGGRYIGTGDLVIQRDPDTGKVNVATYRVQVQNKNVVSIFMDQGKDGRIIREKYYARGKPCPVIICAGHAPDLFCVAGSTFPFGVSEYDVVGGMRGKPVEVMEGESTGLPFPAEAEIAIEGQLLPREQGTMKEGPFGEWPGYYGSGEREEPIVLVSAVYYRDDPIIFGNPPVRPPYMMIAEVRTAARIWDDLEGAGLTGVQGVNMLPAGGVRLLQVIAIQQQYPGHAKQVGRVASQSRTGGYLGRFTIVVEDDINIYDTDEVLWAVSTRCDPATDIEILQGCWSSLLDPMLSPEKKLKGDITNSRAIIDATRPYHWRDEFPKDTQTDPKLREFVYKKWEYLFRHLQTS